MLLKEHTDGFRDFSTHLGMCTYCQLPLQAMKQERLLTRSPVGVGMTTIKHGSLCRGQELSTQLECILIALILALK